MTPTPDPIKTILYNHELRTGVDLGDEIDRESLEQAINNELLRAENRGRTDELVKLSEWGKTIDDQWNAHFKNRLAQLKQSQTKGESR